MSLFKKAETTQAYLKFGIMGLAGSGKTFTATQIAIGLGALLKERGVQEAGKPIFFLDSETGSDFVIDTVRDAGLELYAAKTRSFADLVPAIHETQKDGSILLIDSITHFWRELCETYRKKKKLQKLEFHHWNAIKGEEAWGSFTERLVNSPVHIIMCGRLGYEYENETDEETGKKSIVKADVKMKAEGETGYEPSVLVMMEREMDMRTHKQTRVGYVLKERFNVMDGAVFRNPTFNDFLPHIKRLNLGGQQLGVDSSRNSVGTVIDENGDTSWRQREIKRQIAVEEVGEEISKMSPGRTEAATIARKDLFEKYFGTRSWKAIEEMKYEPLCEARNRLWIDSRGHGYGEQPPPAEPANEILQPGANDPPKTEAAA